MQCNNPYLQHPTASQAGKPLKQWIVNKARLQHTHGSSGADLRSNIEWGPKLVVQVQVSGAEVSSAKVNNLYGGVMLTAGKHDILRFQVSVREALAVHEGKELDQAAHQLSSLLLVVLLLWTQQVCVRDRQMGCR